MPNHVTNEVTGPSVILDALTRPYTDDERRSHEEGQEDAKAFWEEQGRPEMFTPRPLSEDARVVDFGILAPEPENIEVGGCSGRHEPGVVCWYEWHTSHWGTKWNGYSLTVTRLDDGNVRLRFQTAWSHPVPIMAALAERHPDITFEVRFADEDLGYNLGQYTAAGGTIVGGIAFEEGSREALEFASRLVWGQSYAEYRKELDDA